jgi:hypothetical protein
VLSLQLLTSTVMQIIVVVFFQVRSCERVCERENMRAACAHVCER